ncbi:uncharacterized protein LOC111443255 [Cucurbita moschata]|uniref:Uncharacterized protein LOC111443255 n=1 Tax=Cucurbita moschata TaxID=3662 RepID=A0A6J1F970_CUCMO|nr:uncharacterized protein LOC111443255 [Cucurbita moschata]
MAALLPSGSWLSLPLQCGCPNPSSFSSTSTSKYTTNFRCCSITQMHSPEASEQGKIPIIPHTPPLRLAASAVVFLGLNIGFGIGARSCSAALSPVPPPVADNYNLEEEKVVLSEDEKLEKKKMDEAFEEWKSKKFALTVPLSVIALRDSIPPSWIKEFIQSQGKRLKFNVKFNGTLGSIFSDLSVPIDKGKVKSSSVMVADLVSIGDSWLNFAIKKALIEPIHDVDDQEWFNNLSTRWKVLLRRNSEGEIDPGGKIWSAPYRWGCMVIAYNKVQFRKNNLAPMEDWSDLWRPELRGRISMVDSPREVIGAVLKYMGASYNTKDISSQIPGGKDAVQQNLTSLAKQVRLFDSTHYLKAFAVGDVWVAVGWSSDVLPVVKRMSNIAVVVPKSGSSLWADLWAIPATSRIEAEPVGGRVKGPSPLIHQWIEFCLQPARALPFKQEVVPGASPASIEGPEVVPKELFEGKPKLDTNLIGGVPPLDILEKCEFLEPLSESTSADFRWFAANMQKKPNHRLMDRVHQAVSSLVGFVSQISFKN